MPEHQKHIAAVVYASSAYTAAGSRVMVTGRGSDSASVLVLPLCRVVVWWCSPSAARQH
jgi:hypothetical protein